MGAFEFCSCYQMDKNDQTIVTVCWKMTTTCFFTLPLPNYFQYVHSEEVNKLFLLSCTSLIISFEIWQEILHGFSQDDGI